MQPEKNSGDDEVAKCEEKEVANGNVPGAAEADDDGEQPIRNGEPLLRSASHASVEDWRCCQKPKCVEDYGTDEPHQTVDPASEDGVGLGFALFVHGKRVLVAEREQAQPPLAAASFAAEFNVEVI